MGGGNTGLMGLLASSLLASQGTVIGVFPREVFPSTLVQENLSEIIWVKNIEQRKKKMLELADVFIALPGGIGTFEEIFTVSNAIKLQACKKKLFILNINNYYDPLIQLLSVAVKDEFVDKNKLQNIFISDNLQKLFQVLH